MSIASSEARRAARGGETLVECLVAVALVALVALPALAAMRGALATAAQASRMAEESLSGRFAIFSAAATARFERDGAATTNAASAPFVLPPLGPRNR